MVLEQVELPYIGTVVVIARGADDELVSSVAVEVGERHAIAGCVTAVLADPDLVGFQSRDGSDQGSEVQVDPAGALGPGVERRGADGQVTLTVAVEVAAGESSTEVVAVPGLSIEHDLGGREIGRIEAADVDPAAARVPGPPHGGGSEVGEAVRIQVSRVDRRFAEPIAGLLSEPRDGRGGGFQAADGEWAGEHGDAAGDVVDLGHADREIVEAVAVEVGAASSDP